MSGVQGRVLVIDPEPMVRELVRRRLADVGFEAATASSAREGLAAAREGGVDVILLAASLPDADAFATLAELRALPALAGVSVALLATQRDAESLQRGLELGADDYLRKPIDRVELVARVRALTRLRRHIMELRLRNERQEELNAELARLATRDELTGLANRGCLARRLGEDVERAATYREDLSVVLVDVDHFKRVNDTFGHPAGDAVLRAVAAVVRRTVRKVDFVARYGGEELVIVAPSTAGDGVAMLAERVRAAVEAHATETAGLDGAAVTVRVTASFGAAALRHDAAESPASLLARADAALYRAKQAGRNRVAVADDEAPGARGA